ncbi:MAG: VWA domain-containing protein [Deltaproteobacteria bacterium]|nr:VWA domain-containing protein [Deltaproteobacteria bacterium]
MGLEFAAPAMLAGLALLAVPIIAHLTGYQEVRRVRFPTLRFLVASQQKVRRRTRLEALLLLLLRLLAIAAIVLLFARPTVTWTASALAGTDPSRTSVLLVDVSASMQATEGEGTLFTVAQARGEELIDTLATGTSAAVIAFGARPEVLGPGLTAGHDALRAELQSLTPGAGSTDLGAALARARDLLRDEGVGSANVFVLSDGLGDAPAGLDETWPAEITVHYHDLRGRPLDNLFCDEARVETGSGRGSGLKVLATARAAGAVPKDDVELTLGLADGVEVVGDVDFDGSFSAERTFSLAVPPSGTLQATLSVQPGDDLPIDDEFSFTLAGETDLGVLLVSGDGGTQPRDDETYYLERALQPGAGSLSRIRPRVVPAEELRRIDGGRGDVVVLANVADPAPLAPELLAFVERGGGLLISVGPRVDADRYNAVLGDLLPSPLTEVKARGRGTFEQSPVGLAMPPLEQDAFRVFRTGGASVFASVRFGKVHGVQPSLAPEAEVVLRYSDGLPALLSRPVGAGNVLLFTSSLDDDWTDLPLRSIFVPLVHQLARSLSNSLLLDGGALVNVGSSMPIAVPPDPASPAWVVMPDGTEERLETGAADDEGRVRFDAVTQPGHYQVIWGVAPGSDEGIVRTVFSARVPAEESLGRHLDRAALLDAVPGLIHHSGSQDADQSDDEAVVVRTASLGAALVLALALALLFEGLLIGRRA